MNQTIADAIRPMMPNKCYKCLSIEKGKCMLGEKCLHYNKANLEAEIKRRHEERVERIRKIILKGT